MAEALDQDVETLRRGYELYNAQDFDPLTDLMAPDIVIERDGGQAALQGRAAVRAFMEPDAFESQRMEPLAIERNQDRILVRLLIRAKGAGSEIELEMPGWHVWTFADGRARRLVATFDEKKARVEAGLLA